MGRGDEAGEPQNVEGGIWIDDFLFTIYYFGVDVRWAYRMMEGFGLLIELRGYG